jgi:hypothetical protein
MSADERAGRLIHRFHVILDSIVDLSQDDIERVEELVQVGEWAIALENLCTQLHEYDVELPAETFGLIEQLGLDIGVADRYWAVLKPTGPESSG